MDQVRDIEDLADIGKEIKSCSYYGSRKSLKHAQLVTLPYSMLLHKKTRETLGINLKVHGRS